jgi:hypothetical protein
VEARAAEGARLIESNQQVITWLNKELNDANLGLTGSHTRSAAAGTGAVTAFDSGAGFTAGASPFGVFDPSPEVPPSAYPYTGGTAAAAADNGNNGFKSDSYGNNGYSNDYGNGFGGAPGRPPLRSAYETPAAAVRSGTARGNSSAGGTAVTTTAVPVSASGSSSAPTPAATTATAATGSATTYLTAGIKKDVAGGGKGGKPCFEGTTPAGKANSYSAAAGCTTGTGSSANVVTPDENMKGGGSGGTNGARSSLVTAF